MMTVAAAAAKSLQSCPTLCDPIDGSPPGSQRSVFIPTPKKGNAKECSNCSTIALISHASKVMLKILQTRLY